jgi:hypothetical protein
MPVLSGNQATTQTVQQLANQLKANPDFYNVLGGAAGYSTEPILTIANEVMSRIMAEDMPWKWNRKYVPPFLTVSLQQDYCTQITDMGWLEHATRTDINNSTSNNNGAPKPVFDVETVRDLPFTSRQSVPMQTSFVFNSQAVMGSWQANTAYGSGYGVSMTPRSPIQQFIDQNGNILYIDSTQLGLTLVSPGYTGTPITPPGFSPYGVSGGTEPFAPPNSPAGTKIQDGTVVWTVADPNSYAIRLSPVPALNGLCWWMQFWYQVAPPFISSLQQPLAPIPQNYMYLFRAGVRAQLYLFNGDGRGPQMYAEWEETLVKALRGADRQGESFSFVPVNSVMGQDSYSPLTSPAGIGAAYPFNPGPWY